MFDPQPQRCLQNLPLMTQQVPFLLYHICLHTARWGVIAAMIAFQFKPQCDVVFMTVIFMGVEFNSMGMAGVGIDYVDAAVDSAVGSAMDVDMGVTFDSVLHQKVGLKIYYIP